MLRVAILAPLLAIAAVALTAQGRGAGGVTLVAADWPAVFDLYDHGQYEAFDGRPPAVPFVAADVKAFEDAAQAWVGHPAGPDRRRLVAASVALEVAHKQRASWDTVRAIVEWGCALLRQQEPSPQERWWQLASVTLAESAGDYRFFQKRPEGANTPGWLDHLAHARARFPSEPSFRLAGVAVVEMKNWPGIAVSQHVVWIDPADVDGYLGLTGPGFPAGARMDVASANKVLRRSQRGPFLPMASLELWALADGWRGLLAVTEIAPEAHLHLGATFQQLARPDLALPELREAERTATTPFVKYLASFFLGRLLEEDHHADEAIVEYRNALRAVPGAQSASIALASLLFQADGRAEAETLSAHAVTDPLVTDPLRSYLAGDPARWDLQIAQLRQALR